MTAWYEITPLDTLFFRGAEPMEAGLPASAPLFPPPVSVVLGALRTAVLRRRGVSIAAYKRGDAGEVEALIGKFGGPPPFSVTAILLKEGDVVYAPAPFSWYVDLPGPPDGPSGFAGADVRTLAPLEPGVADQLGITASSFPLPVGLAGKDLTTLGGGWVQCALLRERPKTLAEGDFHPAGDFFGPEPRTGIEIDRRRRVVEGRLYTACHLRLREGVSLLVALDREIGLDGPGVLRFGGEQRLGECRRASKVPMEWPAPAASGLFAALAPVAVREGVLARVFCAGKPLALAGWDLATGFHKPTVSWLPAGSVFTGNIDQSCVPLAP